MSILALRYTTATGDEGFEKLLQTQSPVRREIHVADMLEKPEAPGDVWAGIERTRGRLAAKHTLVGSGSALFVLNPTGNGRLDQDPRVQHYLTRLLFELVEFTRGKHKAFFGICFSTQALAVAINALLNLIEAGMDPQEVLTLEQLAQHINTLSYQKTWEYGQPMDIAGIPEFGVLPSTIDAHNDPIFARTRETRTNADTIQLIHMNRQVIRADALQRAMDGLAERLRIEILSSREVPIGPDLGATRVVTGLRITRALDTTGVEGSFLGTQPHPEWVGPQLAKILRTAMIEPGGRYHGYMGLPADQIVAAIKSIENAPPDGRALFSEALRQLAT